MEITTEEGQAPGFNLLKKLGFSRHEIDTANDVICGRGTVEGAPLLKDEHLPVFDCANKCGKLGKRFIHADGHIRMMAAAQPFISGAISKTINLPNEATLQDIESSYELSWKLGLKANALYRDGSKLSQPLNVKSDEDLDKAEEDDEENVEAAREEIAEQVATGLTGPNTGFRVPTSGIEFLDPKPETREAKPESPVSPDNFEPAHTRIIEKIIERIVERPLRRRLPDTRHAVTHKFDIAGHEGYITAGLYEDGQPGEVFITMAKEGSTIGGLMDAIATLVSVSLQYGVPVESLVRKFEHVRFEPSGMTRHAEIPFAKSLVDYIFRWLAMEFVPGYRAANAPKRPEKGSGTGSGSEKSEESGNRNQDSAKSSADAQGISRPSTDAKSQATPESPSQAPKKNGNGHGRHIPDALPVTRDDSELASSPSHATSHSPQSSPNLRLAIVADPLSQQGTELQADAPACDLCGSITVRSGTCYKCLNCGNSMGCS